MIRILIADDHPVVRLGLKLILEKEADFSVNNQARTAREALEHVSNMNYDLVLLDISLPDRNGLEVLHQLKIEHPEIKVLVISMHSEDLYAMRVLKEGASGYLTKDSAPEDLVKAVRKVLSGGKYVSSSLAEKLAHELTSGSDRPPDRFLSNREFQVMCMIASGKKIKDISNELYLSEKTVSTYRARILLKMNLKNNAEIIRYTINNKLI
ncbi:MAG TPA: response regulator transcription factor [Thermodesulfobacteriota bacterium]|nr:response regulator transcription factor [Thermodesulfobacteriota bacterium]